MQTWVVLEVHVESALISTTGLLILAQIIKAQAHGWIRKAGKWYPFHGLWGCHQQKGGCVELEALSDETFPACADIRGRTSKTSAGFSKDELEDNLCRRRLNSWHHGSGCKRPHPLCTQTLHKKEGLGMQVDVCLQLELPAYRWPYLLTSHSCLGAFCLPYEFWGWFLLTVRFARVFCACYWKKHVWALKQTVSKNWLQAKKPTVRKNKHKHPPTETLAWNNLQTLWSFLDWVSDILVWDVCSCCDNLLCSGPRQQSRHGTGRSDICGEACLVWGVQKLTPSGLNGRGTFER